MANEPGLATLLSGGALFGTVMAALGLRKMISAEVNTRVVPMQNDLKDFKDEISGLHQKINLAMPSEEHKNICRMNSKNVDQRFKSLEVNTQLQVKGLKEHIDTRFQDLFNRMDQRRGDFKDD